MNPTLYESVVYVPLRAGICHDHVPFGVKTSDVEVPAPNWKKKKVALCLSATAPHF